MQVNVIISNVDKFSNIWLVPSDKENMDKLTEKYPEINPSTPKFKVKFWPLKSFGHRSVENWIGKEVQVKLSQKEYNFNKDGVEYSGFRFIISNMQLLNE